MDGTGNQTLDGTAPILERMGDGGAGIVPAAPSRMPHQAAGFVGVAPVQQRVKRILITFAKAGDWDDLDYRHPRHQGRHEFFYEGFDLFTFPENLKLLAFNLLKFVDRMVAKYGGRIDAVISHNEQIGALAASLIAQRLGLPGLDPHSLILSQHKFYMRERLSEVMPEAMPQYHVFPYTIKSAAEIPLPFPYFVKPIKAAFSVLARRVDSFDELRQHLTFMPWEKHIIKRLVRPYNDALRAHTAFDIDAHYLIAETLLAGEQINVDGIVARGEPQVLGIVDAIMYPGTQAFMRWDFPSRLPDEWQAKVKALAVRAMKAVGHDHGFFNIEMTVNRETGEIKIIEINPRMASQFSDLYAKVHGLNLHDIGIQVGLGQEPDITKKPTRHSCGASFVFRRLTPGPLPPEPSSEQLDWLESFDPGGILTTFITKGGNLKREMKWLGSYRYALYNTTAESQAALFAKYEAVRERLGFTVT